MLQYSQYLTQHGIDNVLYHKAVPQDERDAALATMAAAADSSISSSSTGRARHDH